MLNPMKMIPLSVMYMFRLKMNRSSTTLTPIMASHRARESLRMISGLKSQNVYHTSPSFLRFDTESLIVK